MFFNPVNAGSTVLYDNGAKGLNWVITESQHELFKSERGKIERVFAKAKQRFKSFSMGTRRKPRVLAKRWKVALIFCHLDHLAEIDICRVQGNPPPRDFVTLI